MSRIWQSGFEVNKMSKVARIVQNRPYKILECYCGGVSVSINGRHVGKIGVVLDFKVPPPTYWWLMQEKQPRLGIYYVAKREVCWNPKLDFANTTSTGMSSELEAFDKILRRKI